MKIHDVTQRSAAWLALRRGIPTCSSYDRILTQSMNPSSQAQKYMGELVAERITGEPVREVSTAAMVAGEDREIDAFRWYEFTRDVTVQRAGFVKHDTLSTGGSPDGLVGEDGIIEIKCPLLHTHVGNVAGDPIATQTQVQGYLWLTGRKWCDTISYPEERFGLAPLVVRVERDPEWMEALTKHLTKFCTDLEALARKVAGETLEDQLRASVVWARVSELVASGTMSQEAADEIQMLVSEGQLAMARALIGEAA